MIFINHMIVVYWYRSIQFVVSIVILIRRSRVSGIDTFVIVLPIISV